MGRINLNLNQIVLLNKEIDLVLREIYDARW